MHDRLPVPDAYEFHHIGYATSSIERERAVFESLGYSLESDVFEDPVQGIKGCFLGGVGPRIELLENLPGSTTLTPWIDAGIKMYHFAYWVDDIEVAIKWAREHRGKVTVQPVQAVAFGGRRIGFVIFRNSFMLEFIERRVRKNSTGQE
ncbi:VOC family protein [Oxalobacteraceae bacterium OM1]|nr:VOC family protein [Oxalobacteraceae bacterium OM1]